MSRIIAIANQKGGVAKTTTAMNLGIGLAGKGARVLIIDNDPQSSLTVAMGFHHPEQLICTLASAMQHVIQNEEFDPRESIIMHGEGVDFIPSNALLNEMEGQLITVLGRERILDIFIQRIEKEYDFILIDCSPNLGLLTLNALSASDEVIIPVIPEFLSAKGLELLLTTISGVQRAINPNLSIKGIVLTMVEARTNLAKEVGDTIKDVYGEYIPIFDNEIPCSVKVKEALAKGVSIYKHNPKGAVASAYNGLTWEVMAE